MNGYPGKTICCCRHRTLDLSNVRQLSHRDLLRDPPVLHHHDLVHLGQELDTVNRAEVVAQRQKLTALDQQIVGLNLASGAKTNLSFLKTFSAL